MATKEDLQKEWDEWFTLKKYTFADILTHIALSLLSGLGLGFVIAIVAFDIPPEKGSIAGILVISAVLLISQPLVLRLQMRHNLEKQKKELGLTEESD